MSAFWGCIVVLIVGMSIATVGMGLVPGYDTIGIAAPILLTLMRILQGLAVGGEASIDVQWLRGVEGTPTAGGTVAMVMLLVVAAACVGRAWRLAAKPPCD